jgi:diguanylate cyclase (GGDEF)-like protein
MSITAIRDEFGATVQYAAIVTDITELKRSQDDLKHQAFHDALTGLPNRNLFSDRLEVALAHAHRSETKLAVMFVDLDNFKHINDSLGHATGDILLKKAAFHLVDSVREDDTVARLGGDEFIIILENVTEEASPIHVANRILQKLTKPVHIKGHDLYVSASLGITIYPDDGADVETLIKNADMAMYRAKEGGKNNFQLFKPAMNDRAVKRLEIESNLRKALERNEISIDLQPIVDVITRRTIGAEALMRWNRGDAFISPVDFIPIAEESGLIIELGDWVLNETCRWGKRIMDEGFTDLKLSVNLAAMQINHPPMVDNVIKALTNSGYHAAGLDLEVTESSVMTNIDKAVTVLEAINSHGISITVDDFGTGYSSLSYLKRFPIHKLKIDRSFIKDIPHDKDDCAITKTIITMSHSLGLKVVAEGVEDEEQLTFLDWRGCDYIQGFYFSRPLTPENFIAHLAKEQANAPKS